jgi:signal transduction histidine kinase
MLNEFLSENRDKIIDLARTIAAARRAPQVTEAELRRGLPLFLDQLIATLSRSGSWSPEIGESARVHGGDLLRSGFTCAQVVHDYGSICQAVTQLARDMNAPITADEFHTLNGCLDEAIAGAVAEHARLREQSLDNDETERLGALAHELRNPLSVAMLAYQIVRTGSVGIGGSTGTELGRSLRRVSALIDRTMAEVRLEAGIRAPERVSLFELMEELEVGATLEANARELALSVAPVERGLDVVADRPLLAAAVGNLLQNAFKFTHPKGRVALNTSATTDRVLIEVEDQCGGLPPGTVDELFRAFRQRGTNRGGLGLGLSITRKSVEAIGGALRVRDMPGIGCVFTIDLPRQPLPSSEHP